MKYRLTIWNKEQTVKFLYIENPAYEVNFIYNFKIGIFLFYLEKIVIWSINLNKITFYLTLFLTSI